MTDSRLEQQINFVMELDRLKNVFRNSYVTALPRRKENDAEHMWHISVMTLVLQEYSPQEIDVNRILRMLLVHDVVEIDAGDVSVYHRQNDKDLTERETAAAKRIFGILPEDQAAELRGLWEEFEAAQTPEAKFARAVDRLMPLLLNYHTQGQTWRELKVNYQQVLDTNRRTLEAVPALWDYARRLLDDSLQKGYIEKFSSR
jgi:putative hydrolases of HD superfamily